MSVPVLRIPAPNQDAAALYRCPKVIWFFTIGGKRVGLLPFSLLLGVAWILPATGFPAWLLWGRTLSPESGCLVSCVSSWRDWVRPMKFLVADDHAVTRCGVKQILLGQFSDVSFGETQNASETLEKISKQNWDLLLLDIGMPGRGGIDLIKEIKARRPELPVLVLTMYSEDQYAVRAFKNGASGYLTKESVPEELTKAVRKVLSGGHYVSSSLAEHLAQDLGRPADRPPHEFLSDREIEVLRQLAQGKSVTEIAKDLSLSAKTISTYRSRILLKMKMKSTSELMRYSIQNGLTD